MADELHRVDQRISAKEKEIAKFEAQITGAGPEVQEWERKAWVQEKVSLQEQLAALLKERVILLEARIRSESGAAAGPGPGSVGVGEHLLKKVVIKESPSALAVNPDWHRYAYNPKPYETRSSNLKDVAFFGFRPKAIRPSVIPPALVSPVFSRIWEAATAPPRPPADLNSQAGLFIAVHELLKIGSGLYEDKVELQDAFLRWNNTCLQAGTLMESSSSTAGSSDDCNGVYTVSCGNRDFVVSLLECKSDAGPGDPLVQALRHYQVLYEDGARWGSKDPMYRADPLPALVLLLEGPRLSIHAVWTLYQNRVGYMPLTPSYYLANLPGDMPTKWELLAVLAAYKASVQELADAYEARCQLADAALDHMARLREAAHMVEEGGQRVVEPCTLPYSLLDEQLGLMDIAFRGPAPCLIYTARQRLLDGVERRVLVKFVEGHYGEEVHRAWHAAGVAPELYSVQRVGKSWVMVVMELLSPEDGWMPLGKALDDGGEPLKQAVHDALRKAHETPVGQPGYRAVHGDMRCPNIMVHSGNLGTSSVGTASPKVYIVDFDWAGRDGEATYPMVRLARGPRWHPEVRAGGIMRQEHDCYILTCELSGQQ